MTKVTLVNIINGGQPIENLGIESIAAYLRKNEIDVSLVLIDQLRDKDEYSIMGKIPKNSDFYGFSLFHTNAIVIYNIAKSIKSINPTCKLFVGGYLATDAYNMILEDCLEIDFIVLGDGEYPILDAINAISRKDTIDTHASIVTRTSKDLLKKAAKVDINKIPWPSRDYLIESIKRKYYIARISSSRGCCRNCSFCSCNDYSKSNHTETWRGRDVQDVFNEMCYIYDKYNISNFAFSDGSFEDPGEYGKTRIRNLCNLLINHKTKFYIWCFVRAETFTNSDLELIELMREAGIYHVFLGIDAGNTKDLVIYNKKATMDDNRRSLHLFRSNGIETTAGFIMLNPLSSKESLKENYNFLIEQKICYITSYISCLEVYYNTGIYNTLKDIGFLKQEYSYIRPMEYIFEDDYVSQIYNFINEKIHFSKIIKEDGNFRDFVDLLAKLKLEFRDELSLYLLEFSLIEDCLLNELKEFFMILYVDFDIILAQQRFIEFEDRMIILYNRCKILRAKLIKKDLFKEFLLSMVTQK